MIITILVYLLKFVLALIYLVYTYLVYQDVKISLTWDNDKSFFDKVNILSYIWLIITIIILIFRHYCN